MVKKQHKLSKTAIISIVLGVGLLCCAFYFIVLKSGPTRQPMPKATISQLPSQPTTGTNDKQITASSSNNQGTAIDNNGTAAQNTPPSSQWVSSNSGNLTVKTPSQSSQVTNNFELTGVASVDKVQFRLIDDQTGVISQGFINVVDGNFSATVGFKASGTSGRLDVFSIDASGVEINEVQLKVRF